MMTGSLGKLELNNLQIGGFMDWEIDCNYSLKPLNVNAYATAEKFWMYQQCDDVLTATFYFDINNELIIANQAKVKVLFPKEYALNKVLNYPLKMVFCE